MSATTIPDADPATAELWDPHETARLGRYVQGVWNRRAYMRYAATSEIRTRQVDTVLGTVWHLLNPTLSIGVFFLVFGVLLGTDRGVDNFILYLSIGVFMFGYTQRATQAGALSITGNAGLIRAIRFPRAILPITTSIAEAITSLSSVIVMFGVAILTGAPPRLTWLLFPLVFVAQFFFNTGAGLVAARMTVHVRDTAQVLPFLFRMLFYGSGVVFNVSAYASGSRELWFIMNPVYCYLTLTRWCIMGESIRPAIFVSSLAWTVGLLVIGFVWFKAGEEQYARD